MDGFLEQVPEARYCSHCHTRVNGKPVALRIWGPWSSAVVMFTVPGIETGVPTSISPPEIIQRFFLRECATQWLAYFPDRKWEGERFLRLTLSEDGKSLTGAWEIVTELEVIEAILERDRLPSRPTA